MNVSKHFVVDREDFFAERATVYTCEFEDGRKVRKSKMITLGSDNEIVFFPCLACYERLQAQIVMPMVKEAIKESRK